MVKVGDASFEIGGEADHELRREIAENLKTLLSLPQGTCPLARDMGIDYEKVGKTLPEAKSGYAAAITELIDEYEPRVSVEEISFEADGEGRLRPKVVLTYNDGE